MKRLFFLFSLFLTTMARGEVYDCFTFWNELEILKIRFEELYDVVDHFVLVEATKTFSNNPKELVFQKNAHLFEKYRDKIIHIVVDDYPPVTGNKETDNWAREGHQRNAILRGLTQCNDSDIVFISDVDEIIRKEVIDKVKNYTPALKFRKSRKLKHFSQFVVALDMDLYACQLNRLADTRWTGAAKGAPYWVFKHITPNDFRVLHHTNHHLYTLKDAGWHFNTMGNLDQAIEKWNSCSTAYLCEGSTYASYSQSYTDFYNRHRTVPIDESFPEYVRNNQEYFRSIGWLADY